MKCLYQCDVLPVDLTSFNIIHSDFVKHSIIFFVTIFISFFFMYMLSLQNIHTISEEKRKKRKAPSKRKEKTQY